MKYFLYFLLCLTNVLATNGVNAQEAKLVEHGQWGSAYYESKVELNGYYYILTSAKKIDVINPNKQEAGSVVTTIDLEFDYPSENLVVVSYYKLSKYKDYLVLQESDKVSIFSVDNVDELTLLYSLDIDVQSSFKPHEQNDKLYVFDSVGQLHIIEEDNDGFNVTGSLNDIDFTGTYPTMVLGEEFYYVITSKSNDNTYTSYTTNIHKYDLATLQHVVSLAYDSSQNPKFNYIESERFIVEIDKHWILMSVKNNTLQELSNFNNATFNGNFVFKLNDEKLHAMPSYNSAYYMDYYIFSIEDTNNVSLISQQSIAPLLTNKSALGQIKELTFYNKTWLGLSENLGVFEASLSNDLVKEIKLFDNQSGRMGKVAVIGNKLYAPRRNRIDIVDISTVPYQLEGSYYTRANNAFNYSDFLVSSSWYDISSFIVINNNEFQLQSSSSNPSKDLYSTNLNISQYLFSLNFVANKWQIHRYNLEDLSESVFVIDVPNTEGFCSNMMYLSLIKDKLAVVEDCSKSIVLFSDYDNENFSYVKNLANEYSDHRFAAKDEYFYFTGSGLFNVIKLNGADELKKSSSVDFPIFSEYLSYPDLTSITNTDSLKSSVIGDHLLASYNDQIYLYDISTPSNPRFISNTNVNHHYPLNGGGVFQLIGDKIVYSNDYEGKLRIFKINNSPQVLIDKMEIQEDTGVSLIDFFTDPEGDEFSFEVIVAPENGSISGEDNSVYTPAVNYFGDDTFTVKVQDIHGNFIEQEITVSIIAVNDAPTINTTDLSTNEDTELVELLDIVDVEGDQLSYAIDEQSLYGVASLNDQGQLTYMPNTNYFGSDSVKVLVTDIHGESDSKVINILIESVNDLPELIANSFEGTEDISIEGKLTANDIDDDVLSFSVVAGSSANGQISMQSDGSFVFTPDNNFFGQASFMAQVTDSKQGIDQQTIVIN